jgi:alkylated DNA repair dioxygenase AlkB
VPKEKNNKMIPISYELLPDEIKLSDEQFEKLWSIRPNTISQISMYGKLIDIPRRHAVFGKQYSFNGMDSAANIDIPPILQPYIDFVNSIHGNSGFNSILVNWYENGNEYIGYHSDSLIDLVPGSNIYIISFGVARDLLFKHKTNNNVIKFSLDNNSLLTMFHPCQSVYKHSLPLRKNITQKRISITIRKTKN